MSNRFAAVLRPFSRRPAPTDPAPASAEALSATAPMLAGLDTPDPTPAPPPVVVATPTRDYSVATIAATRLVARMADPDRTLQELVELLVLTTDALRVAVWDTATPTTDAPAPVAAAGEGDDMTDKALWHWAQGHLEAQTLDSDTPGQSPARFACIVEAAGTGQGVLALAASADHPLGNEERTLATTCATLAGMVLERRRAAVPAEPILPDAYATLPDHTAMLARIEGEIARGRRFGQEFGLLTLAPDRLADYSATHGAAATEDYRHHLIRQIRAVTREVDTLGRGTDEDTLVLLLPMMDSDAAEQLGNRLQQAIAQAEASALTGPLPTVSGGAVSYPDDGTTAEDLLQATEELTAYARRMGGGKIRVRGLRDLDFGAVSRTASADETYATHIDEAYRTLIVALSTAGDIHDHARRGHGRAVGGYARSLAEACGLSPQQAETIELAGTLHDVDKIGLPEEIIGKKGPLNEQERALLRSRLPIARLLLAQVPAFAATIPLIAGTRERFDSPEPPPLEARIIAIAEAYDAMVSARPYRPKLSPEAAIRELRSAAGGRFDPQLVETFVALMTTHDDAQAAQATTETPADNQADTPEPGTMTQEPLERPVKAARGQTGKIGRSQTGKLKESSRGQTGKLKETGPATRRRGAVLPSRSAQPTPLPPSTSSH